MNKQNIQSHVFKVAVSNKIIQKTSQNKVVWSYSIGKCSSIMGVGLIERKAFAKFMANIPNRIKAKALYQNILDSDFYSNKEVKSSSLSKSKSVSKSKTKSSSGSNQSNQEQLLISFEDLNSLGHGLFMLLSNGFLLNSSNSNENYSCFNIGGCLKSGSVVVLEYYKNNLTITSGKTNVKLTNIINENLYYKSNSNASKTSGYNDINISKSSEDNKSLLINSNISNKINNNNTHSSISSNMNVKYESDVSCEGEISSDEEILLSPCVLISGKNDEIVIGL